MTFPISRSTVTYSCPKPDLKRNLPKEKAAELAEQLIKLLPPKPIDPTQSDDLQRFKSEKSHYEIQKAVLTQLKTTCDDLADAVENSLNPAKRKKAVRLYQQMHRNTPEAEALQKKVEESKKEMAQRLKTPLRREKVL